MQPNTHTPRPIRFGIFEVDLHAGELRKSGLNLRLRGQPFDVLAMLLEQPGEIVTREEIQKKLWPADTFVDFDHSLNTAVNKIREALGDDANNPRFVETVPRRGYRFIYPVATMSSSPESVAAVSDRRTAMRTSPLQKRVALATGIVVAIVAVLIALNVAGLRDRVMSVVGARHGVPLPKIESIAVLPLENLSGDPEQEYFADGMTEELITSLGKIGSLRVISRTSAMRYKNSDKSLPEIGRELNVDAVVEGSVMRSGDRVRITANLLDARSERHLWAESYERDLRDILALQSDVARAIAGEIRANLTPQGQARLARARPVNPGAFEAYLKGQYFMSKWTEEGGKLAIKYFQQAIELDPGYTLAYAGLAGAYIGLAMALHPPAEYMAKARAAALKALEIDETEADAHTALAGVKLHYDWDWPGVEAETKRALELNPNSSLAHRRYAILLVCLGRPEEAIAEAKRGLEIDPVSSGTAWVLGWVYFFAHRYDEAIDGYGRALELDSSNIVGHLGLGDAYEQQGKFRESLADYQKSGVFSWGGGPGADAALASAYAKTGWRGFWGKSLELAKASPKATLADPNTIAVICARLDEKDQALEWLEKGYVERATWMVTLRVDPRFKNLRSDPRFQDLLRRMNFPP